MARYSLHAIGRDRPGIVATIAGALAELGCNLEESQMTILHGQFAVMLIVDTRRAEGPGIEEALAPVAETLDLLIAVRPLPDVLADEELAGELVSVSVHGADHPGIVARIAAEIAAGGGNIVDLASRVVASGGGESAYVMSLSVLLGEGADVEAFARSLASAGEEMSVHCVVTPADTSLL